jgi:hypothetical protein
MNEFWFVIVSFGQYGQHCRSLCCIDILFRNNNSHLNLGDWVEPLEINNCSKRGRIREKLRFISVKEALRVERKRIEVKKGTKEERRNRGL